MPADMVTTIASTLARNHIRLRSFSFAKTLALNSQWLRVVRRGLSLLRHSQRELRLASLHLASIVCLCVCVCVPLNLLLFLATSPEHLLTGSSEWQ